MQGWLKLHRKVTESPLFQDAHMFKLWVLCLTKAAFKPTTVMVERQVVSLLPGQFVTGRNTLHTDFNIGAKKADVKSESTLWRWMKKFEELGMLNIETHNKYSVVTVVKWAIYQGSDGEDEQQSEQQMNNKRTADEQQMNSKWTADEQQMNTKKNVKNLRTEEGEEREEFGDSFFDSKVQKIYKAFGESFGQLSNPVDVYKVFEYTDAGMHEDVVVAAFQVAAAQRKKFPYALDLIRKASGAGVVDLQQFEQFMAAQSETRRGAYETASASSPRPGSLQAKLEARQAARREGRE